MSSSFLRKAKFSASKIATIMVTTFVITGSLGAIIIFKSVCGPAFKQYKLKRECNYAEELIQKQQLDTEQIIGSEKSAIGN